MGIVIAGFVAIFVGTVISIRHGRPVGNEPGPPGEDPLTGLEKLVRKDAVTALPRARELAADPALSSRALPLLAVCLRDAYRRASGGPTWNEMEAISREGAAKCPGEAAAREIAASWKKDRRSWAEAAAASGDAALADRVLEACLKEEGAGARRDLLRTWRACELGLADQAAKRGDAVQYRERLLRAASAISTPLTSDPIVERLGHGRDPIALLAESKSLLQGGKPAEALGVAAAAEAVAGRDASTGLLDQVDECLLQTARSALRGKTLYWPYGAIEDLFSAVRGESRTEVRGQAARGRVEGRAAKALAMASEGNFAEAVAAIEDGLVKLVPVAWNAQFDDPGFDPWAAVPPTLKRRLDLQEPDASPERKIFQLRQLVDQGIWIPPLREGTALLDTGIRIEMDWGMTRLETSPSIAVEHLRLAVAAKPDPERTAAVSVAVKRALSALKPGDPIESFLELSGFEIEALLPGPSDAETRAFGSMLRQKAESLRGKSAPRLFVLSLLSDAIPGSTEAGAALSEILKAGAMVPLQRKGPFEVERLSEKTGRKDRSALVIDNDSPEPLLIILQGTESFQVRLESRRRGAVVMRDGHYRVAAFAPDDTVIAYAEDLSFESNITELRLRIERVDGGEMERYLAMLRGSTATGPWKMLRQPPGETGWRYEPSWTGVGSLWIERE